MIFRRTPRKSLIGLEDEIRCYKCELQVVVNAQEPLRLSTFKSRAKGSGRPVALRRMSESKRSVLATASIKSISKDFDGVML